MRCRRARFKRRERRAAGQSGGPGELASTAPLLLPFRDGGFYGGLRQAVCRVFRK
jgi:hypothetical protein